MKQKNQRHTVPRGAPIRGRTISRKPFVDGTIPVYWAPGQDPIEVLAPKGTEIISSGTTFVPDPGSAAVAPGPTKTQDWNRAGSLLRVPQVVHFTCFDSLSQAGYDTDNPFSQVFVAVRDWLDQKRKGKTFAYQQDLCRYEIYKDYVGSQFHSILPIQGFYDFMVAPPDNIGDFFGTNYLHICESKLYFITNAILPRFVFYKQTADRDAYYGPPEYDWQGLYVDQVLLEAANVAYQITQPGGDLPPHDPSIDTRLDAPSHIVPGGDVYEIGKRRVVANFPKFAGYACKIWNAFHDDDYGLPFIKAAIDDLNKACGTTPGRGFMLMDGYVFDLDADTVKSVIADHFRFDKGTGKDRPFTAP